MRILGHASSVLEQGGVLVRRSFFHCISDLSESRLNVRRHHEKEIWGLGM
jgi:hypothetical protein